MKTNKLIYILSFCLETVASLTVYHILHLETQSNGNTAKK